VASRKRIVRDSTRSLASRKPIAPTSLPHIAELIENGQITIGVLNPVGCVAIANDEHSNLAMLVRRQNESLEALLTRLDHAIDKAINEEIFTDEVNRRRS
jgi:hypothetical protein